MLVEKVGNCGTAGSPIPLWQLGPRRPNELFTVYKYTDLRLTCNTQIGLQGYASMPQALSGLSRAERITYCNDEVPLIAPTRPCSIAVHSCAWHGPVMNSKSRSATVHLTPLQLKAHEVNMESWMRTVTNCRLSSVPQWKHAHPRVAVLDFSRDRKMMSVLAGGSEGGAFTLFTKVGASSRRVLQAVMQCKGHPAEVSTTM